MPRTDISEVIDRHLAELELPGVLSVRPGFLLVAGWITATPAIVVTVDPAVTESSAVPGLPREIEGVPLDVRAASVAKRMQLTEQAEYARRVGETPDLGSVPFFADERLVTGAPVPVPALEPLAAHAAKPNLPYSGPADVHLQPIAGPVNVTLSASPDSGWPILSAFLGGTSSSVTVGLYDFTSAHILDTVESVLVGREVKLVLDHPARNPTADQSDEQTVTALKVVLGSQLTQAWALERSDPLATAWIYPSAYHIKVAVRDHSAVWLSSGNWNNSNQPDIDPVSTPGDRTEARMRDRDWHVVVDNAELATMFEAYLLNDLSLALAHNGVPASAASVEPLILVPELQTPPYDRFFAPQTVSVSGIEPLLTPDAGSYAPTVQKLIASATTSLHLQFQYIELPKQPTSAEGFVALVQAVIDRQKAGVDVKIIMSQYETAGYLEQLQTLGLDVATSVRLQNNVHNKGIVVDGEHVLVSSQNWSSAGTLANRDAGLIIHGAEAAAYFDQIFLHDWTTLATQKAVPD